jgi:hypothetical protein
MSDSQTTLRDALESSFDAVEAQETPVVETPVIVSESPTEGRVRDEQGKFAAKQSEVTDSQPVVEAPKLERPTTWKKEYLPIWDKLSTGEQLTPEEANKLAAYSNQREREYQTGVSTYKSEAQNARHLQDAIAPFMPLLQQSNIQPTEWIKNLGNAHHTLATGSYEQKLQMFAKLAQDYGVSLGSVSQVAQGGQIDPTQAQMMQTIYDLQNQVKSVTGWREQQEQSAIQSKISEFEDASKYPYFQMVRHNMAQFLESGEAQDLKTAYEMASAPLEELVQSRIPQPTEPAHKAEVVAKAKAAAISPRSSAPSGTQATTAKDRRAMLESEVEKLLGASRV